MRLILFVSLMICNLLSAGGRAQNGGAAGELRLILSNVQFSAEKTQLNAAAVSELEAVAGLMRAQPVVRVEIGAHTDASGSASYNLRLSQKRARAALDYLTGQGIPANRLSARGYGESKPLNRCRRGVRCSEAEKRANRRVELLVRGVPADSAARASWLALGGPRLPKVKTVDTPKVPAITPKNAQPMADDTTPAGTDLPRDTDYFSELSEKKRTTLPKPLPVTFAGYTIEIQCAAKPLTAGHALLSRYEAVYLYEEPGGSYCYYTGAFFTLPEAQQFWREKVVPAFPESKVVLFANRERTYF